MADSSWSLLFMCFPFHNALSFHDVARERWPRRRGKAVHRTAAHGVVLDERRERSDGRRRAEGGRARVPDRVVLQRAEEEVQEVRGTINTVKEVAWPACSASLPFW